MALIRPIPVISSENGLNAYVPNAGNMANFKDTMGAVSTDTLTVPSSYRGGFIANVKTKNTISMSQVVEIYAIGFKSDGTCGIVSVPQSGSASVADYDYVVGEIYGGGTVTLS